MVQVVFSAEMKTLTSYKQNALALLSTIYGDRESANIVNYWIEERLGLTRMDQVLRAEEVFLFESYQEELQALTDRKPIQYIIGHTFFHGLKIGLNSSTLIPRPETEELVSEVIKLIDATQAKSVIDMGTGSGCIALAIKSIRPEIEIVGFDNNPDAIDQARKNAKTLELDVKFIVADIFNSSFASTDIIVSNPPYVDAVDLADMPDEYQHEPEIALASGNDGLDFTRRLLREAAEHLTEEGVLVVEVGNSWVALERDFPTVPFLWLEFSEGDSGVFLLTREQLLEHRESF